MLYMYMYVYDGCTVAGIGLPAVLIDVAALESQLQARLRLLGGAMLLQEEALRVPGSSSQRRR